MNDDPESLERGLVLAGLDALRQIGGDAVVREILGHAAAQDAEGQGRVPIVDYLRYRNAAVECLGGRFARIAFETGRTLLRNLQHARLDEARALVARMQEEAGPLPVIGQAAVLGAKGYPGTVRARMVDDTRLAITIEDCPECRGLSLDRPFCFLNQGIVTEFAERYLLTRVNTEETECIAMGARVCRIEVVGAD